METKKLLSRSLATLVCALALLLAAPALSASDTVNINKASKEKLTTLYNVGPTKAKRIVKYRQNDSFDKKKEIKQVDGIGDATYKEIKDRIEI
jgi:competence protein ComEA